MIHSGSIFTEQSPNIWTTVIDDNLDNTQSRFFIASHKIALRNASKSVKIESVSSQNLYVLEKN